MTDEELAKARSAEFTDERGIGYVAYYAGFLAGLKEGRPKWHKVDDGDLPKENKLYLVAIKDNRLAVAYFNGRHWETKFNIGDFGHCVETVIAWCEIPKFEEVENDTNN